MKRLYKATILITDDYSESKDPNESKEIPIAQLEQWLEDEKLGNNGFSISVQRLFEKVRDAY